MIPQGGRTAGKDYTDYGGQSDSAQPSSDQDSLPPRGAEAFLASFGVCLICCLCFFCLLGIAWVVFEVYTLIDTPPLPAECLDSGLQYFPGSIMDFVAALLLYKLVLPVAVGCIFACVGGDSIVGTGVRLMNLGAAIYLPVWGIMMWRATTADCDKKFSTDAYANLLLVFRVEVVLSVLTGIGAVGDLCRPSVDPRSLENRGGYTGVFDSDPPHPPPTAPNPATEGFV